MLLIEGLEYVLLITESVNINLFDRQINACDTRQARRVRGLASSLKSVDNSRVFFSILDDVIEHIFNLVIESYRNVF